MATTQILLAGFGGQGILFAGKMLAGAGLWEDYQISWLPSYGPEMRGGTANCSVCISDELIGSPLVLAPDVLVVMNAPSFDKFIDTVVPGGIALVDTSLVTASCARTDIAVRGVPATRLAKENELEGLANMIMVGRMIAERPFVSVDSILHAIDQYVPQSKAHLVEANKRAVALGGQWKEPDGANERVPN